MALLSDRANNISTIITLLWLFFVFWARLAGDHAGAPTFSGVTLCSLRAEFLHAYSVLAVCAPTYFYMGSFFTAACLEPCHAQRRAATHLCRFAQSPANLKPVMKYPNPDFAKSCYHSAVKHPSA